MVVMYTAMQAPGGVVLSAHLLCECKDSGGCCMEHGLLGCTPSDVGCRGLLLGTRMLLAVALCGAAPVTCPAQLGCDADGTTVHIHSACAVLLLLLCC